MRASLRLFVALMMVSGLLAIQVAPAVGQTKVSDGRIVFVSWFAVMKVGLMNADGGNIVELDATESSNIGEVRWSPDGKWIYYSAQVGGAGGQADIFRVRPNGTGLKNLTDTPAINESSFDIHPRGKKIVFTEDSNGQSIVTANITNNGLTNRTNLVSDGHFNSDPAYHPAGKIVAYSSPADGSGFDIYTINVASKKKNNRTNNSDANFNPTYSPDGKKIAYETSTGGQFDVWKMNANGSNKVNVSDTTDVDSRPAWSTDGKSIYFVSNRTGTSQMHVMKANGANQTQIPSGQLWAMQGEAQPIHKCFGKRATRLGTIGKDTINGTARADVIVTFGGADTVNGKGGGDRICTGAGNDTADGGNGNDRIAGEAGVDNLRGAAGADTINGGTGGDTLVGGKGTDTLNGGPGNDTCRTGENLTSCEN